MAPAEQEEDVSRGQMGPDLEGSQPLMNQEAKVILEQLVKDRKANTPNWQPSKVLQDCIDYTKHLPSARTSVAINNIRMRMVDNGFLNTEVALVGNIMPENAEECRAMVPSTADEQRLPDDKLQPLLDEVVQLQNLPGA